MHLKLLRLMGKRAYVVGKEECYTITKVDKYVNDIILNPVPEKYMIGDLSCLVFTLILCFLPAALFLVV